MFRAFISLAANWCSGVGGSWARAAIQVGGPRCGMIISRRGRGFIASDNCLPPVSDTADSFSQIWVTTRAQSQVTLTHLSIITLFTTPAEYNPFIVTVRQLSWCLWRYKIGITIVKQDEVLSSPGPKTQKPEMPKPRGLGLTLKSHGPPAHTHNF